MLLFKCPTFAYADVNRCMLKKKATPLEIHFVYSDNKEILISNFRRVLNVVCFLLGDSPASEIYTPTFRDTLSVPSS